MSRSQQNLGSDLNFLHKLNRVIWKGKTYLERTNLPRPLRILSHRLCGLGLEVIGTHFGMKGSAVNQASKRLRDVVKEDRDFRKLFEGIENKLLNVET